MENGMAKHYAEMMICMAGAGKLTYEDMDKIMGFPSEEVKRATYEELEKMKPDSFDRCMQNADDIQFLINRFMRGERL